MRQQEVIFVLFLASFIFTTKMHAQEARLAFESDLITIGSVSKSNPRVHYLHFNNRSKDTVKLLETHVSYGYDVVYKPDLIQPNRRDSIGIRISNDLLKLFLSNKANDGEIDFTKSDKYLFELCYFLIINNL